MSREVYGDLVTAVIVAHFAFILFAVFGGLLVLRRRAWMWLHLPAVTWAGLVEFTGWICPLTPLENWLRRRAGTQIYSTGFIEHYLASVIYPVHLTRGIQVILGVSVITFNIAVYAWVWRRRRGGR